MPEAVLLIDHDNAPLTSAPLGDVLRGWLASLDPAGLPTVSDALVRAYGGWWHGDSSSRSRHDAVALYTTQCPALADVNGRYWRIKFEFADYLLQVLPGGVKPRIEHTFVLRPAPQLFAAKETTAACAEATCEMRKIARWVRKRRGCTRAACPRKFGDLWYKPEQKQVDTHLALDLIALAAAASPRHLALVSDDIDFLPALLIAASQLRAPRSITQIRFSRDATYLDDALVTSGLNLLTHR